MISAGHPMKGCIRRIAGICFCLVPALALQAQPEARQASPAPQGQWQLTALVREGAPVPDRPGAQLQEFGEAWWLDTGVLVFWGHSGKKEKDWGLYSWKDGSLKTVLPEGENVTSPNFESKPGVKPQKMRLHRVGHGVAPFVHDRPHHTTQIHAGKRLLYISIDLGGLQLGLWGRPWGACGVGPEIMAYLQARICLTIAARR